MSLQTRLDAATDESIKKDLIRLLEEQKEEALIECLDDGFVRLVDHMGDDAAVCQAARVSYGKGTKSVSDDRGLIRYLLRHRHTTPLEMVEFKFLVRVPMDCWRQWIRHRMASVNEYSTRYSEAIDSQQTTKPDEWRSQAKNNKQGSGGFITDWPEGSSIDKCTTLANRPYDMVHLPGNKIACTNFPDQTPGEFLSVREKAFHEEAVQLYQDRIALGVAREQARKDLPLSTYTEAYWKIDLHNLLHFLALRMDSHAQLEIRTYANAIGELIRPLVPLVWEAFQDYQLNSMELSRLEIDAIRKIIGGFHFDQATTGLGKRERDELSAKMDRLGFVNGERNDGSLGALCA